MGANALSCLIVRTYDKYEKVSGIIELRDFVDSREGFGDLYLEWEDYMDWQERNEAERYNPFDEGHDADDAAFASEGLDDHGQWHDHAEYYDHEPNPYHGDYSEE